MRLYAIKDEVAVEFMPPFPARNDAHALRQAAVARSNDEYAKTHADEFTLYYLGGWNRETGEIYDLGPEIVEPNLENTLEEGDNGRDIAHRIG